MEGIRFATMPQIGKSGVPQVRVGVVGRAMRLIGNHTHFCAMRLIGNHTHFCAIQDNCTCNNQIALGFASCNYLTVTGKIILELHSNVCDYLY